MSKSDGYTTGSFLDFSYRQNCYKNIDIYLWRQTNKIIPQQIKFTGKLEKDNGGAMFFIAEN